MASDAAELIEADLLARFTQAAPRDRKLISTVAEMAADLLHLDASARAGGINEAWAAHHAKQTDALLKGLYMLGSERLTGTQAERVMVRAMRTQSALAALQDAEGRA